MPSKKLLSVLYAIALLVAASAAQARVITHELGTTDVPDNPQRIVVLELSFIDALASVGISPVGIADDNHRDRVIPAYTDIIGDAWTSVGTRKTPSFEVIASLQPDLIIADTSRHSGIYDVLSEIAPTIVLDSITGDYHDAVDSMSLIGEAVGKPEEMAERVAQHRAAMAGFAEQIRNAGGYSAQFGVANAKALYLHSPSSYVGSLLESFGFKSNMTPSEGGSYDDTYVQTSLEQLSEIDPDILILGKYSDPAATDAWTGEPLYEGLTAVKNGNVYEVVAHNWSRLRGMLAAEMLAADLIEILNQVD
ncbi:ABC transporter substrate-binding protein [Roseibium aggregatum]|uniref:ABC transporter substrate-binding protein n=1 Tax=Roseibium aggregatum TaxID=187304 RepID=UPI001E3AFA01|nr:Fe(3+) dicitrate ABC transporter substrate-binding protein [Roseibium aggregatum]UES47975.1 ABC transporter substrate-binding protein [Roseibium aggregatum]